VRAGGASYYEFVVDAADHDVLLSLTPQRGRFAPSLSASFTVARPNASAPDSFSTTPRSWAGGGGGTGGGEAGVVELRIPHAAGATPFTRGFGHGCEALPCALMVGLVRVRIRV
jgi:hypothetical protein